MSESTTVFVVDDDAGSRKTARDLLAPSGHDVHLFESGAQLLAALEKAPPDIVLCDVMMPELDGFEVCRQIKARNADHFIPVVLVTALDDTQSKVKGLQAGADDFVSKPVHGAELRARVSNLIQVGAYQRHLRAQRDEAVTAADDLRHQLIHADRLATLGTFSAGISHELKNIVSVLSSILSTVTPAEGGAFIDQEALTDMRTATQHVVELSSSILRVSRPGDRIAKEVDLRGTISDVLAMMKTTGRTKFIEVKVTQPETECLVNVQSIQAQQVLINLIGNAADALGHKAGNRIDIRLCEEAGYAVLEVADNGPGMSEETLSKLFTPFFTTKAPGVGTGLGLSVVHNIVKGWGGTIAFESKLAHGTQARIRLPVAPTTT